MGTLFSVVHPIHKMAAPIHKLLVEILKCLLYFKLSLDLT